MRGSTTRLRSGPRGGPSTCASSPNRTHSRAGAWESRWPATRRSTMPSREPWPQPLASAFVTSPEEEPMRTQLCLLIASLAVTGCGQQAPQQAQTNQPTIKVRGPEQDRLHQLDALNLAIGLKRAI